MKVYRLDKYNLGQDYGYCFEHEDKEVVVAEAIKLCSEDSARYTYRMETWEDDKMIGSWRFFQNGKEFTGWIKDVLAGRNKSESV